MKIAIPTAEGRLCMHFGHCGQFAIIEADKEAGTIGECELLKPPAHEPGVLPRWLAENGVDVVLAGGMGMRAQQIFEAQGIKVVVGVISETGEPGDIAMAYIKGELQSGDNVCAH